MSNPTLPWPEEHRPPIVGADLWLKVMDQAGYQCECTGECGRTHKDDPTRRCSQMDRPGARLAAVPPAGVSLYAAIAAATTECRALCDRCRRGQDRIQAKARREAQEQAIKESFVGGLW